MIILKDIVDSVGLLTDAGDVFYCQLFDAISKDEKVVVDMTGVSYLPSVFLNVSIGRILDQFGTESLKKHISFSRITKQQANRLTDYIAKYNVLVCC